MSHSLRISALALGVIVVGSIGLVRPALAANSRAFFCDANSCGAEAGCTYCGCTVEGGWTTCVYHCGDGSCTALH